MYDHLVHTTPNNHHPKIDVHPNTFLHIILAAKWLVRRTVQVYVPQPSALTFCLPFCIFTSPIPTIQRPASLRVPWGTLVVLHYIQRFNSRNVPVSQCYQLDRKLPSSSTQAVEPTGPLEGLFEMSKNQASEKNFLVELSCTPRDTCCDNLTRL